MSRRPRHRRGSVLVVVLVVLLVLGLIALLALRQGSGARRVASVERDRAAALGLAEAGLERAGELLTRLADEDQDFDAVLDPKLDTVCTEGPEGLTLSGGRDDDHAPPFPDAVTVTAGTANLRWSRLELTAGAVLVRVDDNADDGDPTLPVEFTGNTGACVEGGSDVYGQNPSRDRDRTVVVTAVGLASERGGARAHAVRALEATFAPPPPAGIVAGGNVVMAGAGVCGRFGSVVAAGDVIGGCLCGTDCPGLTRCPSAELCDARAAGQRCTATSGNAGGACVANQRLPPIPRVSPWDARHAPRSCTAAPCTPFFYLRWDGADTKLYQWHYFGTPLGSGGQCTNPAAWGRICHPHDTEATCRGAGCWSLVSSGSEGPDPYELRLVDTDALERMPPPPMPSNRLKPVTWLTRENSAATRSTDPTCGEAATAMDVWPSAPPLGWNAAPQVTFEMMSSLPPRGVWFVEGNVRWMQETNTCQTPLPKRRTVIALGDVTFEQSAALLPASRRPVAVVAGRDLRLSSAGTTVSTCGPGAVLVHEQAALEAGTSLVGQLLIDDRGTCSDEVTGAALRAASGVIFREDSPPPLPSGPPIQRATWREVPW